MKNEKKDENENFFFCSYRKKGQPFEEKKNSQPKVEMERNTKRKIIWTAQQMI